ncbi:MAG: MBL fold metallo-hydrolase [Acidobacteria bacterium]|nr:MBL fold metallo-hydrolase [Acidobacteriota bacterium]
MKQFLYRLLKLVGLAVILLLALLAYTFLPMKLDVNATQDNNSFATSQPNAATLPEVKLSLMKAGKMTSQQSFSWRGGKWGVTYESGMAAVLVEHPKMSFLYDAGFGANVDAHATAMPWLMKKLANYVKEVPAAEQLRQNGIPPETIKTIFISHSHWDHISGLEDFPGAEVRMPGAELDFIRAHKMPGLIDQMIDKLNVKTFEFTDGPYENFDRSLDLFGDGSVVFVPLPGHTDGSNGMFVNLRSGKRFLFTGDLTWALEGFQLPAERPWMARKLVDYDEAEVRRSIVKVHLLMQKYPNLIVVPAHDRRAHDRVANLPNFEQ